MCYTDVKKAIRSYSNGRKSTCFIDILRGSNLTLRVLGSLSNAVFVGGRLCFKVN